MRLRRPLFAILAVAVFGVSFGAGAAVGYDHASIPAIIVAQAGTSAGDRAGASGGSGPAMPSTAPIGPASVPAATSVALSAGPTPLPARTPTASWPLIAADAPGPPLGFAVHVPVLMYHRVAPADQLGRSLPDLVVAPDRFAAQLEALVAAGWTSITAAALAADLAAGVLPPPRTFVITFDDGRRDGYVDAFPILRRLGLVATFYVITGRINDASSLTASQLRSLASAGMEIGSHTVDHLRVTSSDLRATRLQLSESAARIAAVTGQRAATFAYPFGSVDPLGQSLVGEAGYAMAFTESEGCTMTWPTRLAAPRLRVSAGTSPDELLHELEACTSGG